MKGVMLAGVVAALMPGAASAHIVAGEQVGFISGLLHPISGWDHIIAMVAVGIWGAQLGRPAIWGLPVTFPLVMAVGGFFGLIGLFGLFHGYAHGSELPPGQNALLYSLGFIIATGLLHGLGVSLGLVHRWLWGQLALRMAGVLISCGGAFFLWRAAA